MNLEVLFTVLFEGKPYQVEVSYAPGKTVVGVKKLIIAEMKKTISVFKNIDLFNDWLTLKTLDGDVIMQNRIPEGNEFLAELLVPKSEAANDTYVPLLPKIKQYHTDGLDVADGKYLHREPLLRKVMEKLQESQFVVISSPPASGKTSLFELLNYNYQLHAHFISCIETRKPILELLDEAIFAFKKLESEGRASGPFYVFFDDAQEIYHDIAFWKSLIKTAKIVTRNFKFVISATHLLSVRSESPAELSSYPRITRDDLLISDEEAFSLIDLCNFCNFSLKLYPFAKYAIVKEAAGVVGAIVLSVYKISDRFRRRLHPEESEVLRYFFSEEFSSEVGRLFGTDIKPINDEFHRFLKNCFLNSGSSVVLDDESHSILRSLIKGGALVQISSYEYCFSSPLAKRFYFKHIFPQRSAMQVPADIFALVKYAIEQMSASNLLKSTVKLDDFPKEAVFQHEFMAGLAAALPPSCYICPELSRVFPGEQTEDGKIDGELDFYIDGDLRWGIELLVMGDKISEHMNRFSIPNGKYAPLRVKDYAVVDFRRSSHGKPTNVIMRDKRVSVFFPVGDFSDCVCIFGNDPLNHVIKLSS